MGKGVVKLGEGNWAVKDGNLLAAKETNGRFKNAEFTVARGTRATYVGRDGLIKESNLQDVNLITNGTFDTDSDWTKGTGWSISGGTANCIGGAGSLNLTQVALEIGKRYTVTYTVSNYSTGTIHPIMGGWTHGTYQSSNGTYTEVISNNHASANTTFYMQGKSGFVGSIDNVSVKEYTSADMDVTRATAATRVDENGLVNYAEILGSELLSQPVDLQTDFITNSGGVIVDADTFTTAGGTLDGIVTSISLTIGKTYKLTVEGNTTSSGFTFGSANGTGREYGSGFGTHYFTALHANIWVRQSTAGTTNITSFSIKEVDLNNVPRIDYTGGGCPHILAEPQRTNTETKSNEFSTWSLTSNVTPTADYIVSPDGTQNATRLQFTGNGFRANTTLLSSVVYTLSCFAKRNDSGTQSVGFFVNGSGTVDSAWSLTSDWVRFTYTYTTTNASYAGIAGLSGADVSVFGFQAEQGAYATSYIPTSGSTVTRNTDQFSRDGIASLINSTAGVFFIEMATFLDEGTTADKWIALSDGTANNSVRIAYSGGANTIRAYLNVGGSAQADMTYAVTDVTQFSKIAFSYAANNFNLWVDGVKRATDTSGNVFSANTLNRIGLDNGGGGSCPVKIKQLQVYDTALTDTQLAALTS